MGKKKVIQQTQEEALKEKEVLERSLAKTAGKASAKKLGMGNVYIGASYNNTIVTVTDEKGDVVAWASAGSLGFSGPKKATPFAASKVVSAIAEKLKKTGLLNVNVFVSGVGSGRDSAIRSFGNQGFNILSIKDMTPIPHNGPRPKKVRRV
ncbi:MAG: 30S ribosomal protein S11 [Candidatus Harrisonbacteria bacterium]|nr:30S ribosomal protein S11 [Candidatus Harrisonbacteria bacterium]